MDEYRPKCSIGTGPGGGDRKFWSVVGNGLNIPVADQAAARRLADNLNEVARIQKQHTKSVTFLVVCVAVAVGAVMCAALMKTFG